MNRFLPRIAILTAGVLVAISTCYAQSFRYMDESGNIHWADSISQIPPRYRGQVLAPTPVPTGHNKPRPTPRPTHTPKPKPTPKPKRTAVIRPPTPIPQPGKNPNLPAYSPPTQPPASQLLVPPTPVPNLDSAAPAAAIVIPTLASK